MAHHCHGAQRKSTRADGNSLYTSGNKYTCNTYTTDNPGRATAAKRFFCVCLVCPASQFQPQQLSAELVSKPSQEHCVWSIDNTHHSTIGTIRRRLSTAFRKITRAQYTFTMSLSISIKFIFIVAFGGLSSSPLQSQ